MAAWILYVLLVSLLLGLAALCFEYSALVRKKGTRWLWGAGIIASLAVPFVISSITVQLPSLTSHSVPAAGTSAMALRQMTESALSPAQWISAAGEENFAWSPTTSSILIGLWAVASLLLLGGLLASGLRLSRLRRGWQSARIAGQPVLVAEDVGPAVVGLFDPEIVVPRWLLDSSPDEQQLVIAHEQSHLEANDAQLLLIALALVVCMPWNLPLWWQLRRLRRAIEIDCDARVLRRGHDVGRYGEALVAVGERHAGRIAVVAAMTESKSFLEQRIRTMLRKKARFAWASALALVLVGIVLTAGAAEVSPPNADKPAHKEIAVDPKILEGYVGIYQFLGNKVFRVTRDGGQLSSQLTGQPAVPIFAESKTEFFYKIVDAQIVFHPGTGGVADSLVLHQNGSDFTLPRTDEAAAQQEAARAAARFASQTAQPGGEAALRRVVEGILSGHPNYDEMSDAIGAVVKRQMPYLSKMSEQGSITAIRFVGVSNDGTDSYSVMQEKGATHWLQMLDDKGKIVNLAVIPGP
jgi:beta-lactamase regulating signal transducer with metallopeptidase domain